MILFFRKPITLVYLKDFPKLSFRERERVVRDELGLDCKRDTIRRVAKILGYKSYHCWVLFYIKHGSVYDTYKSPNTEIGSNTNSYFRQGPLVTKYSATCMYTF